MRKLTMSDVRFEIQLEPEESYTPEEYDAEEAPEIRANVDRGYVECWCCVVVHAIWKDYSASDCVGGVTFRPGMTPQECEQAVQDYVDSSGLANEALGYLNEKLAKLAADLAELN
jgi:hypothetical protein